jgi:hypothetical protein
MKVLRGQRLLNQLEQLEEESTYQDLETDIRRGFPNTRKRQNATGPVSITRVEYIPYVNDGVLRAQAVAMSGGNRYQPIIQFREVQYEQENQPTNTTFRAVDNVEYHIQPISLAGSNVKVRCNCLDFYWRFSPYNAGDASLVGSPRPPYNATGQRPPANPTETPGVCKHLIKLVQNLRTARVVT